MVRDGIALESNKEDSKEESTLIDESIQYTISSWCIDAYLQPTKIFHADCSSEFKPVGSDDYMACECFCHSVEMTKPKKRSAQLMKKLKAPKNWSGVIKNAIK